MDAHNDIEVIVSSELAYEKLVVEIYYQDKFIMQFSCENGERMAEFPGPGLYEQAIIRTLPLSVLERGIELAKQTMDEIRYE